MAQRQKMHHHWMGGAGVDLGLTQLAADVSDAGATTQGTAAVALRVRAALLWAGGYTTAQRDTLIAYATTYHGAVLA
ncbi:MAG TPA: hypothetical protein VF178_09715 [Gemmatimonadaceae bacterium]